MTLLALLAALVLASCSSVIPTPTSTIAPSPTTSVTATASTQATPQASATIAPLVDGPLPREEAAALQAVLNGYVDEHHLVPSMSVAVGETLDIDGAVKRVFEVAAAAAP